MPLFVDKSHRYDMLKIKGTCRTGNQMLLEKIRETPFSAILIAHYRLLSPDKVFFARRTPLDQPTLAIPPATAALTSPRKQKITPLSTIIESVIDMIHSFTGMIGAHGVTGDDADIDPETEVEQQAQESRRVVAAHQAGGVHRQTHPSPRASVQYCRWFTGPR